MTTPPAGPMHVVILGGGYSSIWCYRALRRWMGARARITVVAPFADHVFHGFTAEVLDGDLAPELLASPLDECVPRAAQVRGWATRVDPDRREVTVEWQGQTTTIAYDQVVVATGAHDRVEQVPGLAEHGWPLRFPGRAEALLDHLTALDERAASAADRTVVVVGAGFAGTEVAAGLGRRYGDARRIVLVSSSATVVPAWQDQARLQQHLRRNLAEAGVEVLTGTRVTRVDADGVVLADGSRIAATTVVSTLGNSVPVIPGLERFQGDGGLIEVDDCLRVTDGVWSAGDAAAVRSRGRLAPKEALWAIRAGTTVGRNIARVHRTARPRRFGFRGLGTVAAFAPGRSVAMLWGMPLPQLLGWVIRGAFFLWYVPSRRTAWKIVGTSVGLRRPVVVPAVRPAPAQVPAAYLAAVANAAATPGLTALAGGATAADRDRAAS